MIRAFFVSMIGRSFSKDFDDFEDFMRFKKSASEAGTRMIGYCSIDGIDD